MSPGRTGSEAGPAEGMRLVNSNMENLQLA
jgi:hypothetical protein